MGYDFKTILLSLRLQYYLPFVIISGYLLWYPEPEKVSADPVPLPVLQDSDPSTWPQPTSLPTNPQNLGNTPVPPPPDVTEKSRGKDRVTPDTMPDFIAPISVPIPPIEIGGPADAASTDPAEPSDATFSVSPTVVPPSDQPPVLQPAAPDIVNEANTDVEQAVEDSEQERAIPTIPDIISPYQLDEYRLTVGDTISVFAANIPEFTTENIIRSDGSINLPVAGEIFLWDMTLVEAGKAITKHYVDAKVLRDPDISVRLLASSPLKIAIAGEVNRPGAYDVPVLDKKLPTITDVIRVAGGIAGEADLRNVEVYRHNRQGGQELIRLNLFALYQDADLSQNITLRSGDRVIIPNAPVRPEDAGLIAAANISPDTMQVGILGEVLSPGLIQAPTQTALNQALILVGGFNSRAKKSIQLVRTNDDGSVTREKIKIDWNASIGSEQNPILQHRDVVLVGQNVIARYSDFLDRVIGPINRTIPFIGILDLLFPGNTNSGR